MARRLTPEQSAAVSLRGRTVLVSAAAGAGKTSVLVERLMGYILDAADPKNADDFLLITFTRAAAGEMRSRILSRLRELLREDPSNAHLRAQLTRVYAARICTLDSYCLEILRENAAEAGFPAGFRVADAAEAQLTELRVLEETMEELYEAHAGDPGAPFSKCAETYGDMRGDAALSELVLSVWRKTRGDADPDGRLARQLAAFRTFDPAWPAEVLRQAAGMLEPHICRMEELLAGLRADFPDHPYVPGVVAELCKMRALAASLSGPWDAAAEAAASFEPERLKPAKGEYACEAAGEMREARKKRNDAVEAIAGLISGSVAQCRADVNAAAPVMEGVIAAVRAFDRNLRDEKTRMRALDFSDVEHLALGLLAPQGEKSVLAARYSGRFTEIMVDEYQDLSPVQDAIVDALSRDGGNVFYVGDARQSIYSFQMAEPTLFLSKRSAFPDWRTAPSSGPCRVALTKNFRSRPGVLDAVNRLLSRIDCPVTGALRPGDFLLAGAGDDGCGYPAVELLAGAEESGGSAAEAEAEAVALRIRQMLDSGEVTVAEKRRDGEKESASRRPAGPGDVVILMRSPAPRAGLYREALARVGLSCAAPGGDGFCGRPEILAVISLIEVIANSRADIPLLAVLRSPLVLCSPAELAELRRLSDGPLIDCAAASANPKIAGFYKKLAVWRALSGELPPFALTARILADTGLPGLYGGEARENLLALPELLRAYPGSGLRGLPEWIEKRSGASPGGKAPANAVRLMSIHKSKGLEFPVVVLAGLSKRFNRDDQRGGLLVHPRAGLGLMRRDGAVEYPTVAWKAVRAVMDREMLGEELRLLYVGMTRASSKLILSCGKPGLPARERLSAGEMLAASSAADWILPLRDPEWPAVSPAAAEKDGAAVTEAVCAEAAPPPPEFIYPYSGAVSAPSKLTATGLKGRFIDAETCEGAPPPPAPPPSAPPRRPAPGAAPGKLTSAERGSALHLFLQYADFSRCAAKESAEGERGRLAARGLLSPAQAESLSLDRVARFFRGDLGRLMLDSELRREFKFSVLASEADLPGMGLPPGERTLLQGVVDCWFERGDGIWIVDFKSDGIAPGREKERAALYRPQIEAYSAALRMITGKPVARRCLAFLETGAVVEV